MSLTNSTQPIPIKQKLSSFCEAQCSLGSSEQSDEQASRSIESVSNSASLKNIVFDEADELALTLMDLSVKNPVYLDVLRKCPIPEINSANIPKETLDIENLEPNSSSSSQMIKVFDDGKYLYYVTTIDGLRESLSTPAELTSPPLQSMSSLTDNKKILNRKKIFHRSRTVNGKTLLTNQYSNDFEYYSKSADHKTNKHKLNSIDCDERKKQFADNILVSSNALLTDPIQEAVADTDAECVLKSPHFGSAINPVITTQKFGNHSVLLNTSTSGNRATVQDYSNKSNQDNITTLRTRITRDTLSSPVYLKTGTQFVASSSFIKKDPDSPLTSYDRVSTTVLKDLSEVQCYKVNPLYAYFLKNHESALKTQAN